VADTVEKRIVCVGEGIGKSANGSDSLSTMK